MAHDQSVEPRIVLQMSEILFKCGECFAVVFFCLGVTVVYPLRVHRLRNGFYWKLFPLRTIGVREKGFRKDV